MGWYVYNRCNWIWYSWTTWSQIGTKPWTTIELLALKSFKSIISFKWKALHRKSRATQQRLLDNSDKCVVWYDRGNIHHSYIYSYFSHETLSFHSQLLHLQLFVVCCNNVRFHRMAPGPIITLATMGTQLSLKKSFKAALSLSERIATAPDRSTSVIAECHIPLPLFHQFMQEL